MYKKKFNNYSYVGYGQCGIIGKNKRPHHTYNHQELREYLIRYQWAYQKGYYLPKLPDNLYDIFYEVKGIFNVATAPISEMLRASDAPLMKAPATISSDSKQNEKRTAFRKSILRTTK